MIAQPDDAERGFVDYFRIPICLLLQIPSPANARSQKHETRCALGRSKNNIALRTVGASH
jgi:hypothetical protein